MQPFQDLIPQPGAPFRQTGSAQPPSEQWHLCAPDGAVFGPMTTNEIQSLLAQGAIPQESQVCSSLDGNWVPIKQHFPGRPNEPLPQRIPPHWQPGVQKCDGVETKPVEGHKEATAELASPVLIAIGMVALVAIIAVLIHIWRRTFELSGTIRVFVFAILLGGWIIRSVYSHYKSHQRGKHGRH